MKHAQNPSSLGEKSISQYLIPAPSRSCLDYKRYFTKQICIFVDIFKSLELQNRTEREREREREKERQRQRQRQRETDTEVDIENENEMMFLKHSQQIIWTVVYCSPQFY